MIQEKNRKDVFHSELVKGAKFDGFWEMPTVDSSKHLPEKLLPFHKRAKCKDYDRWIHFYTDDYRFECIWRNPNAYLDRLKKFQGVISPDFSLCRDLPLAMQIWNTYRNRAMAFWMIKNGIEVIPNVRWSDERSYSFCFDGIEKGSVVSIGSYGCLKNLDSRRYFMKGLNAMVDKIQPPNIVVYGRVPQDVFSICEKLNIPLIPFQNVFYDKNKLEV